MVKYNKNDVYLLQENAVWFYHHNHCNPLCLSISAGYRFAARCYVLLRRIQLFCVSIQSSAKVESEDLLPQMPYHCPKSQRIMKLIVESLSEIDLREEFELFSERRK